MRDRSLLRRPVLRGLVLLGFVGAIAAARTDPPDVAPAWTARLEALEPSAPLAYFELAEEIADRASDDAERTLARELFARAGALDPDTIARSACLAIMDQIDPVVEPIRHRRLAALASLYGGRSLRPTIGESAATGAFTPDASTVLAVTEAFSHYRLGAGSRALAALDDPEVRELFDRCGTLLPGGSRRFLEDCRHYRGSLRPSLSGLDLERMLRLEIALLAGEDRPWSSEIVLNQGRPLVEVDPDRPTDAFEVDVELVYHRDGAWVTADEAGATVRP